jgi:hypothetical protein
MGEQTLLRRRLALLTVNGRRNAGEPRQIVAAILDFSPSLTP